VAALEFREWLVERLSAMSHARLIIEDETKFVKVAELLGVQPDTLREAMVLYQMKRIEEGRTVPMGDKKAGSGHYQVRVWFPPELIPVWEAECELRHMAGNVLFRSVIHAYLLGDREPDRFGAWVVNGKSYPVDRKNRIDQKALVPPGVRMALARRANKLGITPMVVARALLMEVMEGKHPGLRPIDSAAMYDDPKRYHQGKTG
jgi:hypothetical protein